MQYVKRQPTFTKVQTVGRVKAKEDADGGREKHGEQDSIEGDDRDDGCAASRSDLFKDHRDRPTEQDADKTTQKAEQ